MKQHSQKGFTLVELLIVIAIIGALAVGLIAALDPFEQLRKGSDTTRKNIAIQFFNAAMSYYSSKQQFPWATTAQTGVSLTSGTVGTYLTNLVNQGDLKTDFTSMADDTLGKMFLTSTTLGQNMTLSVCFMPESKSVRGEGNSKYTVSGNISSGCSATAPCYWCIK